MRRLLSILLACLLPMQAHALALMQITPLSDMALSDWSLGDPAPEGHIDVCVYAVLPISGQYAINISSPGGYRLNSDDGVNHIAYSLYWDDGGAGHLGQTLGTQLTNNVTLASRKNANVLDVLCNLGLSGPTARLNLKINATDMTSALSGRYSGVITMLISAT